MSSINSNRSNDSFWPFNQNADARKPRTLTFVFDHVTFGGSLFGVSEEPIRVANTTE